MEFKDFNHREVDWSKNPLLRIHEDERHPPCGHYIATQCLGKGKTTFESPGEAIFPNPPSAFGSVDSSSIFLTHLEEPPESHITSDHSWDDPLTHPSMLPQQPSPLDIVIVQPPCFLGEHKFIIFEAIL